MSVLVEGALVSGVALELVGAAVLAHSHNAESIVELRKQIGQEGTAMGEPDAVSTHAKLLAEKRVGFVLLTAGLVLSLAALVLDSSEGAALMGAVGAATVLIGIVASVGFTRVLGERYRAQARSGRAAEDPDALPEQ